LIELPALPSFFSSYSWWLAYLDVTTAQVGELAGSDPAAGSISFGYLFNSYGRRIAGLVRMKLRVPHPALRLDREKRIRQVYSRRGLLLGQSACLRKPQPRLGYWLVRLATNRGLGPPSVGNDEGRNHGPSSASICGPRGARTPAHTKCLSSWLGVVLGQSSPCIRGRGPR